MVRFLLAVAFAFLSAASRASASPSRRSFIIPLAPRASTPAPPELVPVTRDKARLPAEVCGVVGGYLAFVVIFGIALLTYGRKHRKAAIERASGPKPDVEMKPAPAPLTFDTKTPISPTPSSAKSWIKSPRKIKDRFMKSSTSVNTIKDISNPASPGTISVASFDNSVITDDKERRQREMERLYAAVMEHDAKNNSKVVYSAEEEEVTSDRDSPQKNRSRTDLAITVPSHSHSRQPSNEAIRSPVRAIYPPGADPSRPTSRPVGLPRRPSQQSDTFQPPASPRSILTKHSDRPSSNTSRKSRFKNLRISAPMHSKYGGDSDDEARTPLSPRFYNPQHPPPSPPEMSPNAPTTPGSIDGMSYQYEDLDRPAPLPRPAPQRGSSHPSNREIHFSTNANKSQTSLNSAANKSSNALPLRAEGETALPSTKTTYLERRMDHLGLKSPRTGVPITPYSAYMPFTPITPVTPHLPSKKERKRAEKQARKERGVITEEDEVKDEGDMFGSAW